MVFWRPIFYSFYSNSAKFDSNHSETYLFRLNSQKFLFFGSRKTTNEHRSACAPLPLTPRTTYIHVRLLSASLNSKLKKTSFHCHFYLCIFVNFYVSLSFCERVDAILPILLFVRSIFVVSFDYLFL